MMSHKNSIHVLSRAVVLDQDHILLCKTRDLPIGFNFCRVCPRLYT